MQIINPITITEAMIVSSSVSEPDTALAETAWSASEINADGDVRYVGAPSSTVTITQGAPAVITWAANGLAVDTPVIFTNSGGALPTGLTAGQTYFVRARLSDNTFTVSATKGGRPVSTTSAGSGTHTCTAKVHRIYEAILGQKATVTMTIASPAVVTYTAHGLAAGTPIVFTTTGALPTGVTAGTTYYIISTGLGTNSFQFSATEGGSAVNTSGSQSGVHTCGLAANYNKPPAINSGVWEHVGSTNKWAVFDLQGGTVTTADDEVVYVLEPGRFNGFSVRGLDAETFTLLVEISRATVTFNSGTDVVNYTSHPFSNGDTVVFFNTGGALPTELTAGTTYYVINSAANSFQVATTAGGAAINLSGTGSGTHTCGEKVYEYSMDLTNGTTVGDWYQYFYAPIYQQDLVTQTEIVDGTLLDLPAFADCTVTITIERTGGQVQVGTIVLGLVEDLGDSVDVPSVGIITDDTATSDSRGNRTLEEGEYRDRMSIKVVVDADNVDNVKSIMTRYRSTPLIWIGAADLYGSLNIYGFCTRWDLTVEGPNHALLSVDIESL